MGGSKGGARPIIGVEDLEDAALLLFLFLFLLDSTTAFSSLSCSSSSSSSCCLAVSFLFLLAETRDAPITKPVDFRFLRVGDAGLDFSGDVDCCCCCCGSVETALGFALGLVGEAIFALIGDATLAFREEALVAGLMIEGIEPPTP